MRWYESFWKGDSFRSSADDSLKALLDASEYNREQERVPMEVLMERNVPRSGGGSRGRRRSREPKALSQRDLLKRGRPFFGEKPRVRVHLSIARSTYDLLQTHKVTLASVLDEYVDALVAARGQ